MPTELLFEETEVANETLCRIACNANLPQWWAVSCSCKPLKSDLSLCPAEDFWCTCVLIVTQKTEACEREKKQL